MPIMPCSWKIIVEKIINLEVYSNYLIDKIQNFLFWEDVGVIPWQLLKLEISFLFNSLQPAWDQTIINYACKEDTIMIRRCSNLV